MEERKVSLVGTEGRVGEGQVSVVFVSPGQRYLKALIRGGLGLIFSFASVFIPILHFVLVPFGLLITAFLVFRAFSVTSFIKEGAGQCPYCQGSVAIFKRSATFPFSEVCEHCRRALRIEV